MKKLLIALSMVILLTITALASAPATYAAEVESEDTPVTYVFHPEDVPEAH